MNTKNRELIDQRVSLPEGSGKIIAVFKDNTVCVAFDHGGAVIVPLGRIMPKTVSLGVHRHGMSETFLESLVG